jgi:hypothetical protein
MHEYLLMFLINIVNFCECYLILGSYKMLCVKLCLPVLPLTLYVEWASSSCILHIVWHIGRWGPSQHTFTLVSKYVVCWELMNFHFVPLDGSCYLNYEYSIKIDSSPGRTFVIGRGFHLILRGDWCVLGYIICIWTYMLGNKYFPHKRIYFENGCPFLNKEFKSQNCMWPIHV